MKKAIDEAVKNPQDRGKRQSASNALLSFEILPDSPKLQKHLARFESATIRVWLREAVSRQGQSFWMATRTIVVAEWNFKNVLTGFLDVHLGQRLVGFLRHIR